jgi:hypothetical protein
MATFFIKKLKNAALYDGKYGITVKKSRDFLNSQGTRCEGRPVLVAACPDFGIALDEEESIQPFKARRISYFS